MNMIVMQNGVLGNFGLRLFCVTSGKFWDASFDCSHPPASLGSDTIIQFWIDEDPGNISPF